MDPLRQDDPHQLGPFRVVARLDSAATALSPPVRRYVAHDLENDRTGLVFAPLAELASDAEYAARFRAEAEQARRLSDTPSLSPVTDLANPQDPLPWWATPYVPALPLSALIEAYGAPLPERTVRAVGAVVADTLSKLHAGGFAHAGIAPTTVLLTGTGVRLTGFGTVRAVAPDGEDRSERHGLLPESVPPEQLTGGRPRPLGDVYAVGALLAYAATGTVRAALSELPEGLRAIIAACTAEDPTERPSATAVFEAMVSSTGVAAQAPSGQPATQVATELEGGAARGSALLGPGWLPRRVGALLALQAAEVLAAEVEGIPEAVPYPAAAPYPDTTAAGGGPSGDRVIRSHSPAGSAATETTSPQSAPGARRSRRAVLVSAASGSAGLLAGGAAAWVATSEEPPPEPTAAERLAMKRPYRKRFEGFPPNPLWRYEIAGPAPKFPPALVGNEIAVVVNETASFGIDLRSGKELWQRKLKPSGPAYFAADDLLLIPGPELTALDPGSGTVHARSKKYLAGGSTPYAQWLNAQGSTVWFTAGNLAGASPDGRLLIAYDVAKGRELWRTSVSADFREGHLLKNVLVAVTSGTGGSQGRKTAVAFDRDTGEERWTSDYTGLTGQQRTGISDRGLLIAAVGTSLRGYDAAKGGNPQWSLKSKGEDADERSPFGAPTLHKETVFVSDGAYGVYAVDSVSGEERWQADPYLAISWSKGSAPPDTRVSPSGRRLLTANDVEVEAFDADSGDLLWRFTDLPEEAGKTSGRRQVSLTDEIAVVAYQGNVYGLPLD